MDHAFNYIWYNLFTFIVVLMVKQLVNMTEGNEMRHSAFRR